MIANKTTESSMYSCSICSKKYKNSKSLASHRYTQHSHSPDDMGKKYAPKCIPTTKGKEGESDLNSNNYPESHVTASLDNATPKTKESNPATKIKKGESNAAPKPTAKSEEVKIDPMSNDTSNTKEPTVSCPVCDKVFANKCSLASHNSRYHTRKIKEDVENLTKKTKEPSVSCSVCDRVFANKHSLATHNRRYHTTKVKEDVENLTKNEQRSSRKISCKGKDFSMDFSKFPFFFNMVSCEYCDKPFSNKNSLRTHRYKYHTKKRTRENERIEHDEKRMKDEMQQTDARINLFKAYEIKMKIYQKIVLNPTWKYETLSIHQQILVNVIMEVPELKTVCDVLNQNSGTMKQIMSLI